MTHQGADSPTVLNAVETLGNVTLLERPIRIQALLSAVRTALRARRRQYQARAHLLALQEADRRKDEFLATLAHELRNPLAPIRNSVDILRLSGHSMPVPTPIVETMDRQVGHMVRLVDDLLEVSRITRGKIELRKEPIELRTAIEVAVETSRPLIDAARHRLTVDLPQEPLNVEADPTRLAQVFANLLNNAAKYTEDGGDLHLRAERQGGEAVISVRDTGVGIAPAHLASVFDMFVQGRGGHPRMPGGLGIGLTLVRTLVEMHGGSVAARSDGPGKGSEFTVRLPLSAAPFSEEKRRAAAPAAAAMLPRVLVVDDNRDAADSLGSLLGILGADVHVVHDGQAALDAFGAYRPALVFLDLGMPEMDGFEVARRMRARPDYDGVRLVALTGWGQEKDRRQTAAAGFDEHLVKPPEIDALQALLARAAGR
jgi:signal transduction histidine kinase